MPWEITPKALLTSTCTKSLADDIHSSPRTYPAGDAIIEGYEVGQARFPLGEPMLTAPDDLLLQLPGDGTQNTLLHGLSRHRGEADCLRFPGSSFLPFLQICILLPPSSSRTPPSPRGQLSIPGLSLFPPGSQEGGLGSENCTKEGTQHLHLLSTPPLVPQGTFLLPHQHSNWGFVSGTNVQQPRAARRSQERDSVQCCSMVHPQGTAHSTVHCLQHRALPAALSTTRSTMHSLQHRSLPAALRMALPAVPAAP